MADPGVIKDDKLDLELLEGRPKFGILLDTERQLHLRVAALKLFSSHPYCEVAALKRLVASAVQHLSDALQCPAEKLEQNIQTQADACHGAWVISAALACSHGASSATLGILEAASAVLPSEQGRRLIDQVAFMIGALCLEGPATLRPALLPCIGLLVQGRGHFFSLHPCLVESLRAALQSPSRALRGRAVETLAGMLSEPGNVVDANTIARQLVVLQPELVSILAEETSPSVVPHALNALECLANTGLGVPESAIPHVFVRCFLPQRSSAGNDFHSGQDSSQSCNSVALRCLLQIVSLRPRAFYELFPYVLQRFKEMFAKEEVIPGELLRICCQSPLPVVNFFVSLREQLKDELLHSCGVILQAEFNELRNLEADSMCAVQIAELIFLLVEGLGLAKSFVGQYSCVGETNPKYGTCVAALLSAAIQDLVRKSEASTGPSFEVSSKLANALEDLEEFEFLTAGDVLRLLAYHWPSNEALQSHASTLPQEDETIERHQSCSSTCFDKNLEEKQPDEDRLVSFDELPWFAEYDEKCNKWRCRICAEAGGRNPYAKGIAIKRDQVALRMRIHSGAAVHRNAAEARTASTGSRIVTNGTDAPCDEMLANVSADPGDPALKQGSRSAIQATKRGHSLAHESHDELLKCKRIRQSAFGGA